MTQEELIETITHLAFYTGWPNAVSAIGVAREVFKEEMRRKAYAEEVMKLLGRERMRRQV